MEIKKSNIEFKYDFKDIEGIKNYIFPTNFCCAIIGKPGSGKTTLLRQIMLDPNILYKQFDNVFLMSPSLEEFPFVMNETSMTNVFDLNWIFSRLTNLKPTSTRQNILIIIDDFISNLKLEEKSVQLMNLIFNRRHIVKNATISIIITTQRYMTIPCIIRSTINILFLFNTTYKDLFKIWEEHIKLNRTEWKKLVIILFFYLF